VMKLKGFVELPYNPAMSEIYFSPESQELVIIKLFDPRYAEAIPVHNDKTELCDRLVANQAKLHGGTCDHGTATLYVRMNDRKQPLTASLVNGLLESLSEAGLIDKKDLVRIKEILTPATAEEMRWRFREAMQQMATLIEPHRMLRAFYGLAEEGPKVGS
jgi:hypothetical protein